MRDNTDLENQILKLVKQINEINYSTELVDEEFKKQLEIGLKFKQNDLDKLLNEEEEYLLEKIKLLEEEKKEMELVQPIPLNNLSKIKEYVDLINDEKIRLLELKVKMKSEEEKIIEDINAQDKEIQEEQNDISEEFKIEDTIIQDFEELEDQKLIRAKESLLKDKEQCEEALRNAKNEKETVEYTKELEKIEKELEKVESQLEYNKKVREEEKNRKELNQKLIKAKESLLKDKGQCEEALHDAKNEKETVEYTKELEKIEKELEKVEKELEKLGSQLEHSEEVIKNESENKENKNTKKVMEVGPNTPVPEDFGKNPIVPVQEFGKNPIVPISNKEKESKLPVITGLQVYNKLLQEGPEFKRKHTVPYNLLSAIPIVKMFVNNPLAKKILGVNKYKEEMKDNIDSLSKEEFNALTDFLKDERTAIEYKMPMPFLEVMKDKMLEVKEEQKDELENEFGRIETDRAIVAKEYNKRIKELNIVSLSEEEKASLNFELLELQSQLKQINEEKSGIHNKLKDNSDKARAMTLNVENRSFKRRGNHKFFDTKRNIDNKEQINNLAKIEEKKVLAEREGNQAKIAIFDNGMAKYSNFQTKKGLFQKPKGKVTDVSDRIENRPQMAMYATLGIIGAAKAASTILQDEKLMQEMASSIKDTFGNFTQKDANKMLNSIVNDMNNNNAIGEYSNLENNNWDISSDAYNAADGLHHKNMDSFGKSILEKIELLREKTEESPVDTMKEALKIKNEILKNTPVDELGVGIANHSQVSELSHEMQNVFASQGILGRDAAIANNELLSQILENSEKIKNIDLNGKTDMTGPILSAIATVSRLGEDISDSKTTKAKSETKDSSR